MKRYKKLFVALLFGTAIPVRADAQAQGAIAGQVVAQPSGAPLAGANIIVQGVAFRTTTDAQGRFRIQGIPAGQYTVTASFIGRETVNRAVAVAAGQTANVTFTLSPAAVALEGLVVTATGREQRQREIGATVGQINVAEVELAPVTNFSQLIQGRVPGVTVQQSSGTTGGGSRIRIRGSASVSLSNSPLLIIDGVRVNDDPGQAQVLFTGGQTSSRLNDINPEDIENIEILKGPAASALYGTAAANGVIQVTTKRGRPGRPQLRVWSELGTLEQTTDFPDNFRSVDAAGNQCPLSSQAAGTCTVAQTFTFNPLENPETTPFRDGDRRSIGASVSGGGEQATFYGSVEHERETGVQLDNELEKLNLQANFTGRLGEKLNVSANVGFLRSDLQFPQNDNSALGLILNGLRGNPSPANVEANQGFRLPRAVGLAWKQYQDLNRFTISSRAEWRPFTWLSFNGTTGLDNVNRLDHDFLAPGDLALFGSPFSLGFIENYRANIDTYSSNGAATATFSPLRDLVSTTAVGVSYNKELFNRIEAFGAGLTPGTRSLAGASSQFEVGETNTQNALLGIYVQEQLAINDRLFLSGAVRGDKNTAFGTDIGWIFYPAANASWVISDEQFFPEISFLSDLRLRAGWGKSGLRPGFRDALLFFSGTSAVTAGAVEPAFVIGSGDLNSGAGNPQLRPEVSTEYELGFETGFFDSRVGLEFTYYNKKSEDALINRPLAPSLGSTRFRFENIGEVRNSGIEVLLSGQPIRSRVVDWSLNISASTNDNELVSLGTDAAGEPNPPIITGFGSTQRFIEGRPLGAFFDRPFTFNDADGNGMLSNSEVTLGDERGDTAVYLGNPFPNRELSISSDLRLGEFVKLSGLLDFKGGHSLFNRTKSSRCTGSAGVCAERFLPGTSLEDQAAIIAFNQFGTQAGFIEEADFWKLREVSLSFMLPQAAWERVRLPGNGATLTFAGRNLKTWTDYGGFDPEVNFAGQANFTTADFFTLPAARLFVARLDLTF